MAEPRTTRLSLSRCLACEAELNAATGCGDDRPRPNDLTICLTCGHLMAFDRRLRLRPLTDKEMIDVAGDPRLLAVQDVRGRVIKRP
jgi:hypothetical protein